SESVSQPFFFLLPYSPLNTASTSYIPGKSGPYKTTSLFRSYSGISFPLNVNDKPSTGSEYLANWSTASTLCAVNKTRNFPCGATVNKPSTSDFPSSSTSFISALASSFVTSDPYSCTKSFCIV